MNVWQIGGRPALFGGGPFYHLVSHQALAAWIPRIFGEMKVFFASEYRYVFIRKLQPQNEVNAQIKRLHWEGKLSA